MKDAATLFPTSIITGRSREKVMVIMIDTLCIENFNIYMYTFILGF